LQKPAASLGNPEALRENKLGLLLSTRGNCVSFQIKKRKMREYLFLFRIFHVWSLGLSIWVQSRLDPCPKDTLISSKEMKYVTLDHSLF